MAAQFTFSSDLTTDDDGILVKAYCRNAGLDRILVASWGLDLRTDLALRLCAAIDAGAATPGGEIRTDVNGRTFLSTRMVILAGLNGRLNADLERLGF
jgi:hypothetical protein